MTEESVNQSKIRVKLSRPLTWAEYEHLRIEYLWRVEATDKLRWEFVFTDPDLDSRGLFGDVAYTFGNDFVNVFPTSVRTLQERELEN